MCKRILVADDDPAILDAMRMILELEGYDVDTTVNGETIYKMEKDYPSVLLLDIWMSGQDGREICKFLKNDPLTQKIPIIMVSASHDIMKSAKEAGADDFLEKPFEIEELLETVKKHADLGNKN
ncbi:MAG: response regulator [Candidatus Levyibacteriota bacterium]